MSNRIRAGFYVVNFTNPNGLYFSETFQEAAVLAEQRTIETGQNHLVLCFVAEAGLKPCPKQVEWIWPAPHPKLPDPTPEQSQCKHHKWRQMRPQPRHCLECGLLMWDAGD